MPNEVEAPAPAEPRPICDRLLPPDTTLRAWGVAGEPVTVVRRGRRAIVLAAPGEPVVLALLPTTVPDDWAAWYAATPSARPSQWRQTPDGRSEMVAGGIPQAVIERLPAPLAEAWRAVGVEIAAPAGSLGSAVGSPGAEPDGEGMGDEPVAGEAIVAAPVDSGPVMTAAAEPVVAAAVEPEVAPTAEPAQVEPDPLPVASQGSTLRSRFSTLTDVAPVPEPAGDDDRGVVGEPPEMGDEGAWTVEVPDEPSVEARGDEPSAPVADSAVAPAAAPTVQPSSPMSESSESVYPALLQRPMLPGVVWEACLVGDGEGVIEQISGGLRVQLDIGAMALVVGRPAEGAGDAAWYAAHPDCRPAVLRGTADGRAVPDPVELMAATMRRDALALSEAALQGALMERERRSERLRRQGVATAQLKRTLAASRQTPEAIIGADGTVYAPLLAWAGEGSVTVASSTRETATPVVAVVVEDNGGRSTTVFAAVDRGYHVALVTPGVDVPIESAVALYADGSRRDLDIETGARIRDRGGRPAMHTVAVGPDAVAGRLRATLPSMTADEAALPSPFADEPVPAAEAAAATDVAGEWDDAGGDWGPPPDLDGADFPMGDFEIPSGGEEYVDFEIPSGGGGGYDGGHGGGFDDGFGGGGGGDVPLDPAPADDAEIGRPRTALEGAVTLLNWTTVPPPRGSLWAAELLLAAVDGDAELEALGVSTELQLLQKGFPPTRTDKQRIDEALRGPLRGRVDRIRIYPVQHRDHFVRPTADGVRIIGPRGREIRGKLATRLREAWERDTGTPLPQATSRKRTKR